MQKTLEQYDNVTSKCKALFEKKMYDYGSAWRILRLSSLTDQIFIKAQRIRGLQKNSIQKAFAILHNFNIDYPTRGNWLVYG